MDIWNTEKRSEVMGKILSKNTRPEKLLRSLLFKNGFRYRVNKKDLPGKPDIVLPKYKTIIFVHGCFWHLHENCREGKIPSSNQNYWEEKLKRNRLRDYENETALKNKGWNVIVVWECEIEKKLEETFNIISNSLKSAIKC